MESKYSMQQQFLKTTKLVKYTLILLKTKGVSKKFEDKAVTFDAPKIKEDACGKM